MCRQRSPGGGLRAAAAHRRGYSRHSRTEIHPSPGWALPAAIAAAVLSALVRLLACGAGAGAAAPARLTPFELALQRLEDIRALMQPASAREFSTAVSDIVRQYIEQRFDVTATRRTTEEFLRDLLETSNASLARHRTLLGEFLHQCDVVKFAGQSLTSRTWNRCAKARGLLCLRPPARGSDATAAGAA